MSKHYIDMDNYSRAAHFAYFRSLPYPYVGVTVNVDVTGLLSYCKKHQVSFYLMFLHEAALAADRIPEFRQRIEDGRIAEYDECPTSHTEAKEDGTYCYCTLHHHMPLDDYLKEAEAARKECQSNGITEEEDVASMYFISTLSWLHYTSLIQPVAGGDESNPRITWGKYEKDVNGKYQMPLSVLVHHALIDGIQIARFYENVTQNLKKYEGEETK